MPKPQVSFIGTSFKVTEIVGKDSPHTFKMGREAQLQLSKVEGDMVEKMENDEKGNYIIAGLSKKVSDNDFISFQFAVEQLLYNQSYHCGNLDTNSGIDKRKAQLMAEATGEDFYIGNIVVTLNDLCRLAYGIAEPTTEQKKAMDAVIDILHRNPTRIKYPNGYERESVLCARMDKFKNPNGAIAYNLHLNPIFCCNVNRNFAELPQDFMFRLSEVTKRKTAAHLRFVRLLSLQDKRKPCTRTIETLIQELGLEGVYKTNKGRAEKQLQEMCDAMVEVGMLSKYEVIKRTIRSRTSIEKITFHFNLRFLQKPKLIEVTPEEVTEAGG